MDQRDVSAVSANTIPEAIRSAAQSFPDTSVIIDSAVRPASTTLAELFEDSCRAASSLSALGVRAGDVVAVQLPNWRECIIAHEAVWLSGAVLLPIVPIYGPSEVVSILARSGARAFITTRTVGKRDMAPTISAARDVRTLDHRIMVESPLEDTVPFDALISTDATDFAASTVERDPHGRSLLVYTSGTTSQPKGVQHTDATLLADIRAMEEMRGAPESSSPTLAVFPPGHIAGVLGVLRALTRDVPTIAMDAWNPETAAHLIARHKVGASAGAPIHLSSILDIAERDHLDVSSLREYTTGAANVAGELIRRAERHGIHAWRCYGSTEHPTISSSVADDPLDKRADTDGRLAPGTEIRLLDDDGRDVPPGAEGEILTRGPELFVGYTDADQTRDSMVDGWFRTGDVGRLDADGFLTITDRKKDIIVRGGENISSKEVEDALGAHPAIAEVAAIGAPDDKYGERVCVVVVVKPGMNFGVADAAEHFQECGLARQKTPERVIVVDELPRTASGKVQKHVLRKTLL